MNFKKFFSICCLLFACSTQAQIARIDTIPFTLDKQLLVFKGTVNGVETDFAFDTGAFASVANSKNMVASSIVEVAGKRKVTDANQIKTKIQNIKINDIGVGSFHFGSLKTITFDMPFLYCTNLLLLGQDVIKKLNWKIDFEHTILYVSEMPFATDDKMIAWPVTYKSNRPMINLKIGNTTYKNCLIDFGFTGVFEVNEKTKEAEESFAQKQKVNEAKTSINASMGLSGFGKPSVIKTFAMDSIYLCNTLVTNIPTIIEESTGNKIGVQFFNNFCYSVILNHNNNTYYLNPSNNAFKPQKRFDAKVKLASGKLYISGKSLAPNSTAATFEMDEEIKSINNKTAQDFKDDCDFLLFTFFNKAKEIVIEKLNGNKVIITKS